MRRGGKSRLLLSVPADRVPHCLGSLASRRPGFFGRAYGLPDDAALLQFVRDFANLSGAVARCHRGLAHGLCELLYCAALPDYLDRLAHLGRLFPYPLCNVLDRFSGLLRRHFFYARGAYITTIR